MALNGLPAGTEKRVAVRAMFDRIAPRYDLLNRLLTIGLDQRWRQRTLDAVHVAHGDVLLDLACGTGDLSELAATCGARVVGIDMAREMLRGAQSRRVTAGLVQGDAARLPLRDASVDVVTCGFALRNFESLDTALGEMARVLRPGGRLALLEVGTPQGGIVGFGHRLWFEGVVPRIGAVLSDRDAYAYLPRSLAYLPPAPELLQRIAAQGFDDVASRRLLLGAARLVTGVRRTAGTCA